LTTTTRRISSPISRAWRAASRAQRLRAALALPEGYLQVDDASAAVAAAALVAASNGMQVPGPAKVEELIQSGTVPADDQIRAHASRALSRVTGDIQRVAR
jgi:hypothetical protein